MKQIFKICIIVAAGLSLTACGGSSCSTKEDLEAKGLELAEKMQELAASGDMSKIMSMAGKMQKFKSLTGDEDIAEACELIDELMDEL